MTARGTLIVLTCVFAAGSAVALRSAHRATGPFAVLLAAAAVTAAVAALSIGSAVIG